MGDWIGLAFIGFLILCALFGLWQLTKPYDISVEEFEKRAKPVGRRQERTAVRSKSHV